MPYSMIEIRMGRKHYKGYRVSGCHRLTKEKFQKAFRDRTEAESKLSELIARESQEAEQFRPKFQRLTWLSDQQLAFAERAYDEFHSHLEDELNVEDPSLLLDAAKYYAVHRQRLIREQDVQMEEAVKQFLAAKEGGGCRDTYLKPIGYRLAAFAQAYPAQVYTVQTRHIQEYLNKFKDLETRKTVRRNLHSFFSWCEFQKFRTDNPVRGTERIKKPVAEPEAIPLDRVLKMLEFAESYRNARLLPYAVLGFFCGLRPDEITKLEWRLIDLQSRLIYIKADRTKTKKARNVAIPDNAVEWLNECYGKPLTPGRRAIDALHRSGGYAVRLRRGNGPQVQADAKACEGLPDWPEDGIRHTAITHYVGLTQDVGKTALWAGNSASMIHSHYLSMVNQSETKKFWKLLPARSKPSTIQSKPGTAFSQSAVA